MIRASNSCIVLTNKGTSLLWSMPCGSMLPSLSTASLSPLIASGTTLDTSCAIKPSTRVLVSSFLKLNLEKDQTCCLGKKLQI